LEFENEFVEKYGVFCLAFDGTIGVVVPDHNKKIKYVRKNISYKDIDSLDNLHKLI
jgi:hypothetical protein